MTAWRLALAGLLALLIGVPLAQPILDLLGRPAAWAVWTDVGRLLPLLGTTLLFVAGTLAISLPAGIILAILLFRTDLPLRRFFKAVTVLALFVPLPVIASAWQAALGLGGWLPELFWGASPGRPWPAGLSPAIWISATAALPWIILLVGQGLIAVEGELEEDALLCASPWRVLWHVTLPRCRATIGAAALWVALLTASEISVTDMMDVRTFAEEVYLQFSGGREDALAQSIAEALPAVLLTGLGVFWLLPRLDRALPPLQDLLTPPRLFSLGRWRWPSLIVLSAPFILLAGVPLASLFWKMGLQGSPRSWLPGHAWERFMTEFAFRGTTISLNLVLIGVAGLLVAVLALVCCWAVRDSRGWGTVLLALMALAWAMPAPVIGIGLKQTIGVLIDWFPRGLVQAVLYDPYTPVPLLWAYLIRFLPAAVFLLWPAVRLVPSDLRETAQLEGARPRQELVQVFFPLTAVTFWWTAVAVAALALGEVGASDRVKAPGSETTVQVIFDRMHFGVENDVAALCLTLLALILIAGIVVGLVWKLTQPGRRIPPAVAQSELRVPR